MSIVVIIPAFNEASSIGKVIADIPQTLVEEVVVVNNNSTDATAIIAHQAGATVVEEKQQGYGWACLKGIEYAQTIDPDIIVFLDGDYSDFPNEMPALVQPILDNQADFVMGSRMLGNREKGALLPQAILGNRFACFLMKCFWKGTYTDLGPFRAIRFDKLLAMKMQDKTYGWTIEMQLKALHMQLRYTEIPVSYRKRIGNSKISGTISGTIKASYKILVTLFRYALKPIR